MRLQSAYFKVVAPLRVWRHVGLSDSNTWIGRSRSITTVKDGVDARPGDELHDLPGGTFVTGPDGTFEVSLRPPVPILEAQYHHVPTEMLINVLTAAGRLQVIPAPTLRADYGEARKTVRGNQLRPLHPEVRRSDPSPELRLASALADRFVNAMADPTHTRRSADIEAGSPAHVMIVIEEGSVDIRASVGHLNVGLSDTLASMATAGVLRDGMNWISFDDHGTAAERAGNLLETIARDHRPAPVPGM